MWLSLYINYKRFSKIKKQKENTLKSYIRGVPLQNHTSVVLRRCITIYSLVKGSNLIAIKEVKKETYFIMKNKANKIREQDKLAPTLGGDEMAKLSAKAVNNPYCIARLEAAKYNNRLANRESAANELGISKDSLMDYELNLCKTVPVDKVIVMADVYNAPELLNYYCCYDCPIGKRTSKNPIEQVNISNFFRFAFYTNSILSESEKIKQVMEKVANAGGILNADEKDIEDISSFFSRVGQRAAEFNIMLEARRNKE